MIYIRRVYDSPGAGEGQRYLVDRLWPRGVKRASLNLAGWAREAAPSNDLRHWFAHDPAKWEEFQRRYFAELDRQPSAWEPVLEAARRGPVTLLFGSREREHNNAIALKAYLEEHLQAD